MVDQHFLTRHHIKLSLHQLVDDVLAYLAARGYGDVETVQTAEEDVQFSLPKELRKDLKAAGENTENKSKR